MRISCGIWCSGMRLRDRAVISMRSAFSIPCSLQTRTKTMGKNAHFAWSSSHPSVFCRGVCTMDAANASCSIYRHVKTAGMSRTVPCVGVDPCRLRILWKASGQKQKHLRQVRYPCVAARNLMLLCVSFMSLRSRATAKGSSFRNSRASSISSSLTWRSVGMHSSASMDAHLKRIASRFCIHSRTNQAHYFCSCRSVPVASD